jgi:hypothetical protein
MRKLQANFDRRRHKLLGPVPDRGTESDGIAVFQLSCSVGRDPLISIQEGPMEGAQIHDVDFLDGR